MNNTENTEKKSRNFKKFKYGSMSAVVIALVIAIVVVINVICGVLMNRYPLKLDLTTDKRYELTDETVDALKNLDKEVEIAVAYPEENLSSSTYGIIIHEMLERYSVYAKESKGSIDIKYFDVNEDPDIVAKYNKYYSGNISTGAIVVYSGERVELLNVGNMITQKTNNYSPNQEASYVFTGENSLTSAILNVTDAKPVRAGFLVMMGENAYTFGDTQSLAYAVSSYENLLAKNGYTCSELDILSDKVTAEDYDLIVIPAPFYDFGEDLIGQLEDFLYNDGNYGKNIMYIAHPSQTSANLPNLTEFLTKRGLKIEDSIVKDLDNSVAASLYASNGQAYPAAVVKVSDADSVGTLASEALPIAVPDSRQISVLEKNTDYVTKGILTTGNTATLVSLADETQAENSDAYFVAAKSVYQNAVQFDVFESSVVVIGSAFMLDPMLIQYTTTYNNSNVVLNMTNIACGKGEGVVIPDKTIDQQQIALTEDQQGLIRTVVCIVIPLIVAAVGIFVIVRRKNR